MTKTPATTWQRDPISLHEAISILAGLDPERSYRSPSESDRIARERLAACGWTLEEAISGKRPPKLMAVIKETVTGGEVNTFALDRQEWRQPVKRVIDRRLTMIKLSDFQEWCRQTGRQIRIDSEAARADDGSHDQIDSRAEHTLLAIVAALSIQTGFDISKPHSNGKAADVLSGVIDAALNAERTISKRTIADWLSKANAMIKHEARQPTRENRPAKTNKR
ncbi:hypothetical protein [Ahniella affigens]|nr:hypothetical protein [Ahniella affigens]